MTTTTHNSEYYASGAAAFDAADDSHRPLDDVDMTYGEAREIYSKWEAEEQKEFDKAMDKHPDHLLVTLPDFDEDPTDKLLERMTAEEIQRWTDAERVIEAELGGEAAAQVL